MNNIIQRGGVVFAKIGNNEVKIPQEFINDFSALAILSGVPDSKVWDILTCIFEAGQESGKEKLRQQLRPLVDDLCRNTDTVMDAMKEIEEGFIK